MTYISIHQSLSTWRANLKITSSLISSDGPNVPCAAGALVKFFKPVQLMNKFQPSQQKKILKNRLVQRKLWSNFSKSKPDRRIPFQPVKTLQTKVQKCLEQREPWSNSSNQSKVTEKFSIYALSGGSYARFFNFYKLIKHIFVIKDT